MVVDTGFLTKHRQAVHTRMAELTEAAVAVLPPQQGVLSASRQLNLGSSKQLAAVLYEELKLPEPTVTTGAAWLDPLSIHASPSLLQPPQVARMLHACTWPALAAATGWPHGATHSWHGNK